MLAGLPQTVSQKVWHFRARRKSFPEGFGISALGESRFPKGLAFPRLAKYPSQKKTKQNLCKTSPIFYLS